MLTEIVSIVLAFILTGVTGNWLVQKWQHRNWLNEQMVQGEQKDYAALAELWDQLNILTSRRLWRMQRALIGIELTDEKVQERLSEYDVVLSEWNENFNSMIVRLTLFSGWELAGRLENEIQPAFVSADSRLHGIVRSRLEKKSYDRKLALTLRRDFNVLSRLLFEFNRDALRVVELRRVKIFYGVQLEFSESNIHKFRTWELLQALFKPGIKSLRVTRSASDFRTPLFTRN